MPNFSHKNSYNPITKSIAPELKKYNGIEIKGIHIGMTNADVAQIIGENNEFTEFTIAGVRSMYYSYQPLTLEYYAGKLDDLSFFFKVSGFEDVLGAIKNKYPSIKCTDSVATNAMGGSFSQVSCIFSDSESELTLERLVDIKTSILRLTSKRRIADEEKSNMVKKKDI